MTQEEKAKAYDEAVERARIWKDKSGMPKDKQGILDTIFPELAESEDERIRKALVEMVHDTTGDSLWVDYNVHKEDALAWLERQGEQKTIDNLSPQEAMDIAVAKCFEQGEQKPDDKVDLPEFESHLCLMFQKFRAKGMCTNGEIIDYVKEHSQKLRDILVNPAWSEEKPIQEIKPFEAEHGKYYYCIKDYFCGGKKQASKGDVVQALRGLPIMGLKDASEYFLPVNFIKCNSAWSEEDNIILSRIIADYERSNEEWFNAQKSLPHGRKITWLKSLENRVQPQNRWKPDKVVIQILELIIQGKADPTNYQATLMILVEQLKKLK